VPIEDNFPYDAYRPMNAYLTAAISYRSASP
jgi:hypothetical protein